MYRIGVIGDKNSVLVFKTLGIEVFFCDKGEDARKILRKLANKDFGIIFIIEELASTMLDDIKYYNDKIIPSIILIPSHKGTLNIGMDNITENIEKAVGINIL